jgi:hypothetical protein
MKQSEFVDKSLTESNGDVNQAIEMVRQGILSGECPYSKMTPDLDDTTRQKLAKNYASAVVKDALKKDKKWNGGVEYVPLTKRGPRRSATLMKNLKQFESYRDLALEKGCDEHFMDNIERLIALTKSELEKAEEKEITLPTNEELEMLLAEKAS